MQLRLGIKPLSTNAAWRGRRFKSKDYQQYERDIALLLPISPVAPLSGELAVSYTFHLKNYALTDVGNLEKQVTDILVKRGYILDDRYIKVLNLCKEKSDTDAIEVDIWQYNPSSTIDG